MPVYEEVRVNTAFLRIRGGRGLSEVAEKCLGLLINFDVVLVENVYLCHFTQRFARMEA